MLRYESNIVLIFFVVWKQQTIPFCVVVDQIFVWKFIVGTLNDNNGMIVLDFAGFLIFHTEILVHLASFCKVVSPFFLISWYDGIPPFLNFRKEKARLH